MHLTGDIICILFLEFVTSAVRGAMLTGFFGSTGCNGFFATVLVAGLREIGANGATLAVLRSTLRAIGEVIEVSARTSRSLHDFSFDLNASSIADLGK